MVGFDATFWAAFGRYSAYSIELRPQHRTTKCDKHPILVFCDTTIFLFKKELENVKKWYKMVYI